MHTDTKTNVFIKLSILAFIIGLLVPFITHAQIQLTEIMYDPSGTDAKREWIEVYNSSDQSIDLTTWFFFENNVYHKINANPSTPSNSTLAPGQFAIIADSIAEVLIDFPNITHIFDSVFSLNNTGEPLALANSSRETIDAFTYSSEMGGAGDGNSLQINEGLAITALPTPGASNATDSQSPPTDDSGTTSDTDTTSGTDTNSNTNTNSSSSTHSSQTKLTTYTAPIPFKIGAGRPRTIPIKTPVSFEAEISTDKTQDPQDIKYTWNFGDLSTDRGSKVTHIYEYPGTYNVVLEAKGEGKTAITRTKIHIINPELQIIQDPTTISITNTSTNEFNIGEFILLYTSGPIPIPRDTIIDAGQTFTFTRHPHHALIQLQFSDQTPYISLEFLPIALSSYIWCSQNTHTMQCNPYYIAKLFDIIQGWLL
jgi:hypothetical protein